MAQRARPELYLDQHTFDSRLVLGSKWSMLWGDKRNLKLSHIDLSKVVLRSTLRRNETSVVGRVRHERLMAGGDILLGPEIFYELREYPEQIPESWAEPVCGQPSIVTFDGGYVYGPPHLLVRPKKRRPTRYVLYLMSLNGSDSWGWGVRPIDGLFNANHRAATLPWNYGM